MLPRTPSMLSDRESRNTPTWKEQAARWWYVVRYHRTSQLAMRIVSLARRKSIRMGRGRRYLRPPKVAPKPRGDLAFASLARRKLAERGLRSCALSTHDLLQGRYRFLNIERTLPDPIDWRLECWPEAPHLWRFHLHYHEFLLDLTAQGLEDRDRVHFDRAWNIATQWIENNKLSDSRVVTDAWHPYCISRRLPVWMYLWSASPPSSELRELILGSMHCQTRYLEHHLEWDVRGNHLLENAKALMLIGAFLDCPHANRWLAKGATILRQELAEQILPHGEHFERSPMYHAQMLEAVLDVRDGLQAVMPDLARLCAETAAKMAAFLREIVHPDGEIPLLGDSSLGEPAPVSQLVSSAAESQGSEPANACDGRHVSERAPEARRLGDYWICRQANDFLLFDAGPVGPDHLPAHAHADLLSFEASIQGRRFFVDSGVFGYQDDPMRRYCRSTKAHNVLQIDGRDQCDMWSRFRMGYRGWPSGFVVGEELGFHWARARHDAYRRLGVRNVGRWIACRAGGPWLCVDWADGQGRHELSAWLHLHPDVAAEKVADSEVRLELEGITLQLRYLTAGQVTVTDGWYAPRLGHRKRALVVRWTATASLPTVCGWCLVWGDCHGRASIDRADPHNILLRWTENNESLRFQPTGKPFSPSNPVADHREPINHLRA
ncbi:MAG: alginate lyase family protein [Proteobacteria bacterium]|nr:alginate lyase family protein [Pseudomonadota bacterium]